MEAFETGFWFEVAKIVVESLIVILLWKTVKDYSEVGKLSRIESKQRFRAWVGPSSGVGYITTTQVKQEHFSIAIKNFGEIPASNVTVKFAAKTEVPTRDLLKSEKTNDFNLGPLLPNMEKQYWVYIDTELIEKSKSGTTKVFIFLYLLYDYPGGRSGYGLISRFEPSTNSFVHTDMWID